MKNTTFTKKVWTFFIYEWIYLGPKYDTTQKSKYQKSVKSTFFCTFLGVLIWVVIVHKYFFPTTNSQKVIILPVFGLRIRHRLTIGSPCSYKQKLLLKIMFFFSYPPPPSVIYSWGKGGLPKPLLGFSKDFWPATGGEFFGYPKCPNNCPPRENKEKKFKKSKKSPQIFFCFFGGPHKFVENRQI